MPPPGTNTEHIERGSQATPLAEDVLKQLQGELSQGAFGHGVGPAQRNSTDWLTSLLTSMTGERGQGGIDPTGFLDALGKRNTEFVDRQATDLGDTLGPGTRFGSQTLQAATDLRRGAASDYNVTSAQSMLDAGKFNAQFGLAQDQALMAGMGQLFDQGTGAINPFLQMAQMGILPEEITQSPNWTAQLLNAGTKAAAAYATKGASLGTDTDMFGQGGSTVGSGGGGFNPDPNVFAGNPGFGMQDPRNQGMGNMGASFDPNSVFFGTFGGPGRETLPKFGQRR